MKISILQRREDFDAVFRASLTVFLKRYFEWDGKVTSAKVNGLAFRQNAVLNVVHPDGLAHHRIAPITREFRYAKPPLRRWFQTIYVALATRTPLAWLASRRVFWVTNAPKAMSDWVVVPGNHTNRILDTAKNISIVFPKVGFDRHFFEQDAMLRQQYDFLLAPKIIEAPAHKGWFIEERVEGLPLNRLKGANQQKTALDLAMAALIALRTATAREVPMQAWAESLDQKISALVARIGGGLSQETTGQIKKVQFCARVFLKDACPQNITVCQSHGDFQPANILVNAAQIYLIDWEYSAERMAQYDTLVFQTECRHAKGLGARLHKTQAKAALVTIFLLEDLLLKLQENAAPAILKKGLFLDPWLDEVVPFLTAVSRPKAAT